VVLIIDEGIIYFTKWFGAILGLFVAAGLAFYSYDAYNARNKAIEARDASQAARNDAEKARNEAQKISVEAQTWLDDVKARLGTKEIQVNKQVEVIEKKIIAIYGTDVDISAIKDPVDVSTTIKDPIANSVLNLANSSRGIQANIDALDARVKVIELWRIKQAGQLVQIPAGEQDELNQKLRIKQVPTTTSSLGTGNRASFDLSFTLCMQNETECNATGLQNVDKVVYHLDKRWFAVPKETRSNSTDQFAYELRVWGVTKITACIYLKGQDRPIVRSGLMNLVAPQYWGPEASAAADEC
jgi:hypothetical protein